jgi:hypothetical protein
MTRGGVQNALKIDDVIYGRTHMQSRRERPTPNPPPLPRRARGHSENEELPANVARHSINMASGMPRGAPPSWMQRGIRIIRMFASGDQALACKRRPIRKTACYNAYKCAIKMEFFKVIMQVSVSLYVRFTSVTDCLRTVQARFTF